MNRNVTPVRYPDKRKISIIIPAAGLGSRMKSYGPKSLIKIKDDLTIVENQLKYIFKYFYKPEVILVTGYNSNKIREALVDKRISIVENYNWEINNVGASIKMGLNYITHKNVLILHGDLVFNAWTLKAPFGIYSMLLVDKIGLMKNEEVGCIINDKRNVVNLMYDLPNKWAQIAYFTGLELEMLKEQCSDNRNDNKYGFEILNSIIELGGNFSAYSPPRMKIIDIDSSKDLNRVKEVL